MTELPQAEPAHAPDRSAAPARNPVTGGFLGALPDQPLVARDQEMERLLTLLSTAERGHSQAVMLAAEPGIGKTRLAQEVMLRAQHKGFRVLVGRCYEQHSSVPYFPFIEVLSAGMQAAPILGSEIPKRWPELARIVPDLTDPPLPASSDPNDMRLRVLRAATGFVQALAGLTPVAVLLDDLHWADSASLDLLLHLARSLRGNRVLLLGTYRDVEISRQHPLETTLRNLFRERLVEEVTLRGLPPEGTAALIRTRFGVDEVSPELVELLHRRTEGNPFFTEEVLKALVEQGAIYQDKPGQWQRKELAEIGLPRSVRSVIGQRVDQLPTRAQDLLRIASVTGQEFDLGVLVAASGEPESAVLDALDAALAAGLVEARCTSRHERYAFSHALIQQALYEELPAHRARRWHLRMGEVLEQLDQGQQAPSDLARHFIAAADLERALRYSLLAGDRAAELHATPEAIHYYRTALDLLREGGDERGAAAVRVKLAQALSGGSPAEAIAFAEQALTILRQLGDAVGQALAHRAAAWAYQVQWELQAAAPHLEEALRLWPAERQDAELVHLLLEASRAQAFSGQFTEARTLAERGAALAERLGDPLLEGRALVATTLIQFMQGSKAEEAIAQMDRAEQLARAAEDWTTLVRIHHNRGEARLQAGDLLGNLTERRQAVEIARLVGPGFLGFAHGALVIACYETGEWAEGRQAAQLASREAAGIVAAWYEGRFDDSLRHLRDDLPRARERGDTQEVLGILLKTADILLQLGRITDAEEPARELVGLVRDLGRPYWGKAADALLAEVLVWQGSPEAERYLRQAEQLAARLEIAGHRPRLLRVRGLLLWRRGELNAAVEALRASAEVARVQHALIQLGQTLAVLRQVAQEQGDAVLAAQADAERLQIVERIGPECRGLAWARGLPAGQTSPSPQTAEADAAAPASANGHAGPLSQREAEVAALVAQGLTNRQIAETLVISERTAANHVQHILNKLGFSVRAQIATWATEQGLPARS